MSTQVLMPQLGLTMTEGLLTEWVKKEGEPVHTGDLLFYVENDKATLPVEAQADGVLSGISVKAGETAPVGTVVALILAAGEKAGSSPSTAGAAPLKAEPPKTPPKKAANQESETAKPGAQGPVAAAPSPSSPAGTDEFVLASPRARSLARDAGLDLHSLKGSGPDGAVLERDLPANAAAPRPLESRKAAGGVSSPSHHVYPEGEFEVSALSRIGQIGAERMVKSWTEIPQFTLFAEACAEELIRIRERNGKAGVSISVTVLLTGLLARAIRDYPRMNSTWAGDGTVRTYRAVDVGIAMDTPDGLVVPVLRDCANKGFRTLALEMDELAKKAKSRTLGSEDLAGGTITLSNLGMFGVKRFRAIVNPPQTAIIAVGTIDKKPVEEEGEIRFKRFLEFSVTADHRTVDGAYAARFLSAYKERIESPASALD